MRLYNTLTRREEEFVPSRDNLVRMYACGLTAYARGHIGNFRTFVAIDVLRRALKYQAGFDVRQVMNFTDDSQPPITVHVNNESIKLDAAGRTMSLAL